MTRYTCLSDIQKTKFKEASGYEYDNKSLSGCFTTDRPFDIDDWNYSPWTFSFIFEQETGNLFCELDHRMTNNRTNGWDQNGNAIESSLVDKIYPPHS